MLPILVEKLAKTPSRGPSTGRTVESCLFANAPSTSRVARVGNCRAAPPPVNDDVRIWGKKYNKEPPVLFLNPNVAQNREFVFVDLIEGGGYVWGWGEWIIASLRWTIVLMNIRKQKVTSYKSCSSMLEKQTKCNPEISSSPHPNNNYFLLRVHSCSFIFPFGQKWFSLRFILPTYVKKKFSRML